MRAPQLITTPATLKELARTLNTQSAVAVDTESNSLYAFKEQVCLLQFTAAEHDYLVDPLALDDLKPLGDVFANPAIEVIFHAAEYDVLTLKRDFDFTFANLFDTMLAARIAGRNRFGLGSLLEEEFGVTVEKKYQRADWGQRPLAAELINYARYDTHYLIQLRGILYQELVEKERLAIAEEDFKRLAQVNGEPPGPPEINIWRIKGADDLNANQTAILHRLAEYRHGQAEKRNMPLFKIIQDKTLIAITIATPRSHPDLARVPGMSEMLLRRHGKALLSAVEAGLRDDPLYRPRRSRPDDEYIERYEALKNWRKKRARGMNVESDVILPRDILEDLAEKNPNTMDGVRSLMAEVPWRRAHFANELFETLQRS
jgi:ribonuclease D